MTTVQFALMLAVPAAAAVILLIALASARRKTQKQLRDLQRQFQQDLQATRTELAASLGDSVRTNGLLQTEAQKQLAVLQDDRLKSIEARFQSLSVQTELRLGNMRDTMESRLVTLQNENTKKLDEMRQTVDEKLQKTLDEKLAKSFGIVSDRLEQVYRGLGEMQTLASGVGDLKKVLSNVKTRGMLGEIQLGAILSEILAPEQYAENVATHKGTPQRVEYAVRLPSGEDGGTIWLPIDAKFPGDSYRELMDAYDSGNPQQVEAAGKNLEVRIRSEARDIRDKYIHVPDTTDFGILFLPTEGLYAEVIRRGMVERLQREFKVNIAGPSTMAALLNSLQMGFRTLAIQKRSGEVWTVLGEVKSEFETFGRSLEQTQARLHQASDDLENLVGVRTRQIRRRLDAVSTLPDPGLADNSRTAGGAPSDGDSAGVAAQPPSAGG